MTDYLVLPPARRVHGTVRAPSSKSATNRALLLAALSPEPVEIVRPLDCHDTRVLARCLEAMGAVIEPAESGLFVRGPLGRLSDREIVLDAGSSGTAARFLAALAAAVPGTYLLTGSPRLTARPMSELAAALVSAGASVRFEGRDGHLPLRIRGGSLRPGAVSVDASRSSQFLSALLLAGAAVEGGLAVRADGPVASAPYVEMTIETLEEFGHDVRERDGAIEVRQGTRPAVRYETPGDYSSAMPLLAAAGILGGEVVVTGLRHPSRDADALALGALEAMGVAIERDAGGGTIRARGDRAALAPAAIEAGEFPDSIPPLAALAAFAAGESCFRGIAHLRWKESDRIASLAALVAAAGATAAAGEAELCVAGPPRGAGGATRRLPTFEDHRIAMAAGLLCLAVPGALVESPGCVAKSYPDFFRDLETILLRG